MRVMFLLYIRVILMLFAILAGIGYFCWPYSINTWLAWADKPPTVQGWHGALLGCAPVAGQLSIPAAIITWIATLFILIQEN